MVDSKDENLRGIEIAVRTSQAHRRELIQTFENLREQVRAVDSNCACRIFEDLVEPNRFFWVEWWATSEQIRAQLGSDRFSALLGAVKVLGTMEGIKVVHSVDEYPRSNHGDPDQTNSLGVRTKEKK